MTLIILFIDTDVLNRIGLSTVTDAYPDYTATTVTDGSVYKNGQTILLRPAGVTAIRLTKKPVTTTASEEA